MTGQPDAASVFYRYRTGINFMTPTIVRYGWTGPLVYELSKGDGIERDTTIWGVTVVSEQGRRDDLSKCCHSKAEAEAYVRELAEVPA